MAIAGDLELVLSTPGTGPGAYDGLEQMQMFEFPFLFEDNDQYRRVLKGAEDQVTSWQTPSPERHGRHVYGSRDMLTTVPVKTLADMKDLVMRGPNAIYNGMSSVWALLASPWTGTIFILPFCRMSSGLRRLSRDVECVQAAG